MDPRRHAKGREEHLLIHEGPLRAAKNTLLAAEDAENTKRQIEFSSHGCTAFRGSGGLCTRESLF